MVPKQYLKGTDKYLRGYCTSDELLYPWTFILSVQHHNVQPAFPVNSLIHTRLSFPDWSLVTSELRLHQCHFAGLFLPWRAHWNQQREEKWKGHWGRVKVGVRYRNGEREFYSSLWPARSSIIDGSVVGRCRGWPWNAPRVSCGSVLLGSWTWFLPFAFLNGDLR